MHDSTELIATDSNRGGGRMLYCCIRGGGRMPYCGIRATFATTSNPHPQCTRQEGEAGISADGPGDMGWVG